MTYVCVTSMNKDYYNAIGQVMLESWLTYWPKEISLFLYAEGFTPDIKDPRLIIRDWNECCENDFNAFRKLAKGPALKFAKKGFSFLHMMENPVSHNTIWLDADLLFYKPFTEKHLESLMSNEKLIALFDGYYQINPKYTAEQYIDIQSRKNFGAESGFIIVNCKHTNFKKYAENYRSLYLNTKHSLLGDWYDSEVVILAAREFLKDVEDLSRLRTTDKTQTPMNRCWLSEYMSHQKAKSKSAYTVAELKKLCGLV